MAKFSATVDVAASPPKVHAYLADLSNRLDWDPSVREVTGHGDHFDVIVGFYGKAVPITYTVDAVEVPSRITFSFDGKAQGREVCVITAREGGSSIDLEFEVTLKGLARLLDRGFQLAYEGIGENVVAGLKKALG